MGTARTKLRIFSIALTSMLLMSGLTSLVKYGVVQDYVTAEIMLGTAAVAALVFLVSVYAALVLLVEGLVVTFGTKLLDALAKEDKNES